MEIAVLLSTYNGEKFLRQQLDSLLAQTVVDSIHLMIRDDGSQDRTLPVLEEYRDRIRMTIYPEENIGPGKSFWKLFTHPEIDADFFAFCDQDDVWDPDKLEKGLNCIRNLPGPQLWCSNCRIIDGENRVEKALYHEKPPNFSLCTQMTCGAIQGCAILLNRALRKEIISREIPNFPMHDLVVITHAIIGNCLHYDHEPSFSYRIHTQNYYAKENKRNISTIQSALRRWRDQKHRLSDYARFLMSNFESNLAEEEKVFLKEIARSPVDPIDRIRLLLHPMSFVSDPKIIRSFKTRAGLGLL